MSNHQMTLALNASGSLTMSTLEIAERTGKRHDHVIRDVRVMLDHLKQPSPQFWGKVATRGRPADVAYLPKRECLILVSGYSVELRAAIIDRWQELEAQVAAEAPLKVPRTLAQALRLAADQAARLSHPRS